jgi:hypothetical protein
MRASASLVEHLEIIRRHHIRDNLSQLFALLPARHALYLRCNSLVNSNKETIMKTSIFAALLTVVLSMALPTSSWAGGPRGGKGGMQGAAKACKVLSQETLSDAEIDTLMYMREEEKMARDLYIRFNEVYGTTVRVFGNISLSEQKHMDAVKGLLDAYGLPDPVKDDAVGVFTNPVLAAQFTELLDQGDTLSLVQ